jgi:hypothetical protein
MTPSQREEIERAYLEFGHTDFWNLMEECEWAHQTGNIEERVLGIPNNEIRNAFYDATKALREDSYTEAQIWMAFGRRHLRRARRFYLAAATSSVNKHIATLKRRDPLVGKTPEARAKIEDDLQRFEAMKSNAPEISAAQEGRSSLVEIQDSIRALDTECLYWLYLLRLGLQLCDTLSE